MRSGCVLAVVAGLGLAAFAVASRAASERWIRVGPVGSERYILYESLTGDAADSRVKYRLRLGAGAGSNELNAEVDCAAQTRRVGPASRDELTGNMDSVRNVSPLGSLRAEVNYVCAWLARQSDADADARQPTQPTPTPSVRTFGSGFLVTSRQAVTNHHVITGCKAVSVRQEDQTRSAQVAAAQAVLDLALLTLDAPMGAPASVRTAAALGEEVMVAGHPLVGLLSSDIIVTKGQVNSLSGLGNDPTMFQLSAAVHSGNSGGPVLDRSGAVVGVVVSKLDAVKLGRATGELPQNINFAIKPEVLRLFLDTNRVRYQSAAAARHLEGPELAEKARQATVQVFCTK